MVLQQDIGQKSLHEEKFAHFGTRAIMVQFNSLSMHHKTKKSWITLTTFSTTMF